MKPIPTGSLVAMVTPMLADGCVDFAALRRLVDWHVAEGTSCIVAVGTTGESPTVNVEEHCEVIRVAVDHAKGRIPIMAGAGANSTSEAIELTECAKRAGAQAGATRRDIRRANGFGFRPEPPRGGPRTQGSGTSVRVKV